MLLLLCGHQAHNGSNTAGGIIVLILVPSTERYLISTTCRGVAIAEYMEITL